MKFVDQGLFDVSALTTARFLATSEEAGRTFLVEIFASYQSNYPGDNLWTDQALATAKEILHVAKNISPENYRELLAVSAEVRKTLDDDLKPISKMGKIFGGSFFSQSHPAPASRAEISIKNCRTLLLMVNSRL